MADAGADCAIVNGSYSILEYMCNDNRQKYSLKIYNLDVILSVCSILERTAADGKTYKTKFFNLDMILSVGYRVNSRNAVNFRRWASKIFKDYLLKGYSINARLISVEKQLADQRVVLERHTKSIEFFVRTSLPPVEGIFYDGQIFDAYVFVLLSPGQVNGCNIFRHYAV